MLIYAAISFSASYASRYEVPQLQVIQGPLPSQKTISSEEGESSHSDGTYAVLNVPEGHHIYGPEKVQEPVYSVLQDPKIMFQNYSPDIDQLRVSIPSLKEPTMLDGPILKLIDCIIFYNYGLMIFFVIAFKMFC